MHHTKFIHKPLAFILSGAILLTGPLAPFAQGAQEKENHWASRRSAIRRQSTEDATARKLTRILSSVSQAAAAAPSTKNWFEVGNYTPVFGPRSWKRGKELVPFVTIIQDAHDNYEAQLALSRTLAELAEKEPEKPLLVCVEGAWGPVEVRFLRDLVPPHKINAVANELLRQALISGEEHRALLDDRIQIFGVENKELHRANTLRRRYVAENSPYVDPWLYELSTWRNHLIQTRLPSVQKALIEVQDSFDRGQSDLETYLKSLVHLWGSGPLPKGYGAIETYLQISKEGKLKDIRPIIQSLLDEKPQGVSPNLGIPGKTPQSFRHSVETNDLKKFLNKGTESYEKIRKIIRTRESAASLKPAQLDRETKAFYAQLVERSIQLLPLDSERSQARTVMDIQRWIKLRIHLANLEMNPDLIADLFTEPMNTPWTWVRELAQIHKLDSQFPNPPYQWAETEKAAMDFYRLAILRNGPLVKGTLSAARAANSDNAVLVAGGFHTPGIQALFREEGAMHQTFCPRFDPSAVQSNLRKESLFMSDAGALKIKMGATAALRINAMGSVSIEESSKEGRELTKKLYPYRKYFFVGLALLFFAALVFATPVDPEIARQVGISFQKSIEARQSLLAATISLFLTYIRIPTELFEKTENREPDKEELTKRSTKKINRLLNDPGTYDQALDVLISLHSNDPDDEIVDAIFSGLNEFKQKIYMVQALEDPRWAMELAHVIRGKSRRERAAIAKEAIRLIPESNKDRDEINSILDNALSNNRQGIFPQTIQSSLNATLERYKKRLESRIFGLNSAYEMAAPPMGEDTAYITDTSDIFQAYNIRIEATRRGYPSFDKPLTSEGKDALIYEARKMRGLLNAEIEFLDTVAAMRPADMAFPSNLGIGLEKWIGFGHLKQWGKLFSTGEIQANGISKTNKLLSAIEAAWMILSKNDRRISESVIEANNSNDNNSFQFSATLRQPEFSEVLMQTQSRIKSGTAPVVVALPWAQAKEDFLSSIEKTSRTPSEVQTLGGQRVVRFHAGPFFTNTKTVEQDMIHLMQEIGKGQPTVLAIDLDELVGDLASLSSYDKAATMLQETFVSHLIDHWQQLLNKPTLLFLTSEDNDAFYLPEKVTQQALRVEPTRDSVHLSLLETLAGIRQAHPTLSIEDGVVPYVLTQIYGESSLTLPDAHKRMAWVAAQKALLPDGRMTVDDLRDELKKLPLIDKLPIAQRVRAVSGKVTPEFRDKIFKIANELRRARASPDQSEAARKEQFLDTLLGLFFFWKNTSSQIPTKTDPDQNQFREQAKRRFKEKYSGLDHIFDQLFDMCVLPKLGTNRPDKAPPSDIPLLVGSPGVGKTSLGHALAEMFGTDDQGEPFYKFAEISLAGESDGSKITGFSSTYAKSTTGAPLQLLRQAGTNKVVLLIDEIDKAPNVIENLTRLLDQNAPFIDNYLGPEFPIDTRDIQIVLTANSLEFLKDHPQIADRVHIVHVPDYQPADLVEIATRHLLPQVMEEEALSDYMTILDPRAFVKRILADYPSIRSPRSIKKTIEQILRDVFDRNLVRNGANSFNDKINVEMDDIKSSLGPPQPHPQTALFPRDPGEVAMLAAGFDDLFWVRAERVSGPPPKALGKQSVGNVEGEMQLSAPIAVRINNKKKDAHNNWVLHTSHPNIKKSGNSAGLAMGLAVFSEQEGRSVRQGFAVTGHLKPNEDVGEIAGLEEKIPSGLRHGVHSFVLPRQNMDNLLDLMVYNPFLSGVVLRKEKGLLLETLVFPQEVPEIVPGDPMMDSFEWESLFENPPNNVRVKKATFVRTIKGWQVEGTPEAIAQWLQNRPALVPLNTAPTYFLCSTFDDAIDFSLEPVSSEKESKEDCLKRLGVKQATERTIPPSKKRAEISPKGRVELAPIESATDAERHHPAFLPTTPPRGRDPFQLPGITSTIVRDSNLNRENYFNMLSNLILKATELDPLEGLRACNGLILACQGMIKTIKRKAKYSPFTGDMKMDFQIQLDQGLFFLEGLRQQSMDLDQRYSSLSAESVREKIQTFIDPVVGMGKIIKELDKFSQDTSNENAYRTLLMELWAEHYFFAREDLSRSELGLSMLALRGALDVQNAIDNGLLQDRNPPIRNSTKCPPDTIDQAARHLTPYFSLSRGGILTFTVEEEAKPFLLDSLASTVREASNQGSSIRLLEINFSVPTVNNMTKSIVELLRIVEHARAAGGTALVIDLDRLFDIYGKNASGVLGKIVQIAETLQPATGNVRSFLPLPLIFVGKEQAYYRASDICPEFDTLALVVPAEAELGVLIRRTADSLSQKSNLPFSNDAISFAIAQVKNTGYEIALEAMKSALGRATGEGMGIVSESLLKRTFQEIQAKIAPSNSGYSLSWIKERIQLIQDESIKRLAKTYYGQLLSTSRNDPNYATLYSYMEAVARFPWDQVSAPLADEEDVATLLKRLEYAEAKFNETHFGMDEVQRIIRHTLQSNWRRLNHRLPPRGPQYTFWGSPGTGKTSAVAAMARALTYNGAQGLMTPYGSWDIDMAGMDDPSNLLGFLKTYIGARWGSLYGGIIETGLYSIFGIDEPSRAKPSNSGNPTDALTRFLDPAFRNQFTDTFIGFAVPLGPLMVVLLTNDRLPSHIEDRTILVTLPDPTPEQLAQIGQRHTITRVTRKYGIQPRLLIVEDPAMHEIVTKYVKHGARDLQRILTRLGAIAANNALKDGSDAQPVQVTLENLGELLGPAPRSTARNLVTKGALCGEALTFLEGIPSMVEAVHFPREGVGLYPTLSPLFDVPMKESAELAFDLAVAHHPSDKSGEIFIDATSEMEFKGASRGLAYYMAIGSAITGQPVPEGVAYLGELDSRGQVTKVTDDLVAASVSNAVKFGLKKLVLPEGNKAGLETFFFSQPRLAARIRFKQKDTLRIPYRNAGPRPDWAPAEVIALWEKEQRQTTLWNDLLNSQELRSKAKSFDLTLSPNEKEIQIAGTPENLDRLLEEYVQFTPPLTLELIRNVKELSPPEEKKGAKKITNFASFIGAIALTLTAANLVNLAFAFTAQAATLTVAASSAVWIFVLGFTLLAFIVIAVKRKGGAISPSSDRLPDLLRIGNLSPNPAFNGLVANYARTGEMTPAMRAGLLGFLNPPSNDTGLDQKLLEEVELANQRTMNWVNKRNGSVLPDIASFLDFLEIGIETEGAPPPVITFDWASLLSGKTKTLLDGIAQNKSNVSALAFVATDKGVTNTEMEKYIQSHWPGLGIQHKMTYIDREQIEKENLSESHKVQQERVAKFISQQNFNGSEISLRVLVCAENQDRWAGLTLDIFPMKSAYYVENLVGSFRTQHLIFNIQA